MRRQTNLYGLLLLVTIGCGDFLTGPRIDSDPNRATEVSADLLFNAVQVSGFLFQEGNVARSAAIWMQQMAGTDRQSVSTAQYSNLTEFWYNEDFSRLYTGGGLVDIRQIVEEAQTERWRVYAGMAKVWEALNIGTAASIWGDLPYSEAVVSDAETPRLDRQRDIYDALQILLDEAIADLQSGQGYVPPNDHVYGGDAGAWIEAAYTLKARLYLHWSNYAEAFSAAQNGIGSPAGNFRTRHTQIEREANQWFRYLQGRASEMRGGQYLIDLMKARMDPRLPLYFAPATNGDFQGAGPGEANTNASSLSDIFLAPALASEILTWAENQLIQAEAAYQMGDEAVALERLNEVRAGLEAKWTLPAGSLPARDGLTGRRLFEAIMEEKYIALFLNIEVWNDWKRTDLPPLVGFQGKDIPRRLVYGLDERTANSNVPAPDVQPRRNANDQ